MAIKIQLFRNFCLHPRQAENKPYYIWKTALISLAELLVLAVDKDQLSVLLLFNIWVGFWEVGCRWSSYLASWQPQSGHTASLSQKLHWTNAGSSKAHPSTQGHGDTQWPLSYIGKLIRRGPGEGKGNALVILESFKIRINIELPDPPCSVTECMQKNETEEWSSVCLLSKYLFQRPWEEGIIFESSSYTDPLPSLFTCYHRFG